MGNRPFVARQRELGRLGGFLKLALAGQGQVCFVVGEAGSGKTTLVSEFAQQALGQHQNLVIAVGQSDAQTGTGDAYLPFREVLGQLTGDVEAKLAQESITEENAGRLRNLLRLSGQALVEVGPDLIGLFIPGAGLATRLAGFVAGKVGWLDRLERLAGRSCESVAAASAGIEQSHIFEQYTNVLKTLAEKHPMLIVLDDLQWADGASMDLLFRLGRRVGDSSILIVGTYRPAEVALGRAGERHPLDKVLAEFKRYAGDIYIDLELAQETEGRQFVDAFLDVEPNRLGEGFRQALYRHTDGHPLFVVELLRDMQERGDLVHDEQGHWVEGPALDWTALPARVEGVIEERIGRLEEELREALTVASVQGEDFTAEVVARVREIDVRAFVRRLSRELDKQHRLVAAQGIQRLGSQRLSLYRFQHNLFQKYLYGELDEVERAYLHEDVGTVLEDLYRDWPDDLAAVAVQLAFHFAQAGLAEKAVPYLRQAGEQAAARFANAEAEAHFSRALELAPEGDLPQRYALLLAREKIYDLQGEREAQQRDLLALEELAERMGDDQKQGEVALRRAEYAEEMGDYAAASEAAQWSIQLAQNIQDIHGEAEGHIKWGSVLIRQGQYETARRQFEQALSLAREAGFPRIEATSLRDLGTICWHLGDPDGDRSYGEQALRIYREIGDRRGESGTLNNLGLCALDGDRYAEARAYFEQALPMSHETGDRRREGMVLNNLGLTFHLLGDYMEARGYFERAIHIFREIRDPWCENSLLISLGAVDRDLGDYARARTSYEQALHKMREIGERRSENITLSNLSLIFHQLGDDEAAREYAQQALQITREISERSSQAHALTNLGHALAGLGRLAEAADAYQEALAIRREVKRYNLAIESLAGLARVTLAQGELARAQAHVEEILAHLQAASFAGTDEPFRIYLTCYRVLQANGDPRAREVLTGAHDLLQERAARIEDEELRRSFLEDVPAHREIVREFALSRSEEDG